MSSAHIDEWFSLDGPGYEHLDEHGIVDMVNNYDNDNEVDSDNEDEIDLVSEVHKCPVSNVDAMDMFDKCLTWLRWQPEASLSNTAILVQMREMAASKREAARVQPTIDSFFNRK